MLLWKRLNMMIKLYKTYSRSDSGKTNLTAMQNEKCVFTLVLFAYLTHFLIKRSENVS